MTSTMKPTTLQRACAHPVMIAWALFAVCLNAFVLIRLAGVYTWPALLLDPATASWLALLCAITTLASVLPASLAFRPVSALCARYNGAPLQVGDEVRVLAGEHRGKVAKVDGTPRGQGGWLLARLDLGQDARKRFLDLFEQHALLRINPRLT